MKVSGNSIVFLIFAVLTSINTLGQTIVVQNTELSGTKIKIARHYGDNIFLLRELNSNEKGKSIFYFDSLKSGIYYVILPDSSSLEFLYDSDYQGKILIEQKNNSFKVLSAPDVTQKYSEYVISLARIAFSLDSIKTELKQHNIKNKEKKNLLQQRDLLHTQKKRFILSILTEYKGTMLGSYLKAQQKIEVPKYTPPTSVVNKDSASLLWRIEYFNKHYLDNLDIADERLINTPVYTSKINSYLDKITLQQPKNLKISIDYLLTRANSSTACKIFLSNYLLNKYKSLKNNAIYEVAYLHIIEKYYLKSKVRWLSNNDINKLSKEYNHLKPLELGQTAPNIRMKNQARNDTVLNTISSEYTILYFYNYDCEICKKTTPSIKKTAQKYSSDFVNTFAVCLGNKNAECSKYIIQNNLSEWVNVYDSKQMHDIAVKYSLRYTPTIFILNKNKIIVGKNLNTNQLEQFIKQKAH